MSDFVRIGDESELGTLPALPPGTIAERAAPDGHIWRYVSVGRPALAIRTVLGWAQGNVWLPEQELYYIQSKRPGFVTSLTDAMAEVLARPLSVHENPQDASTIYFLADANDLRAGGLVQSRRTRLVDLVVERRRVLGGTFLRIVHFSPTTRNFGGRQLWP
jgi:hypothetical protein